MLLAVFQAGLLSAALHLPLGGTHANPNVTTYQGTFADGATYIIQVPQGWNGTLVLYSHGYVFPGSTNYATDVGDPTTGEYLLLQGYALGGSSYASTGWAIAQALPDQIAVLDTFANLVGKPKRTIAWGHSMGGIITAGLVQQYPTRFDGALPMCGVVAGGVGFWNSYLDSAFAFNTLLASSALQVVNISDPLGNYDNAEAALGRAQNSAEGRARIALAAALADTPGWLVPGSPPPRRDDYATQEANQFVLLQQDGFLFDFYLRAELEGRAGGNPSWNAGIDYRKQLAASVDRGEVKALYAQANLNLDGDLQALNTAASIQANPNSLTYLSQNIIFDGKIPVPVLTLHTEGDGVVMNQNENAYETVVQQAHDPALLREVFVHRAGHCAFTPGETVAAFKALIERLDAGRWEKLTPTNLNNAALALGIGFNSYPPSYAAFAPAAFLRPYDGTPPRLQGS